VSEHSAANKAFEEKVSAQLQEAKSQIGGHRSSFQRNDGAGGDRCDQRFQNQGKRSISTQLCRIRDRGYRVTNTEDKQHLHPNLKRKGSELRRMLSPHFEGSVSVSEIANACSLSILPRGR
jgi:hypothetical protein